MPDNPAETARAPHALSRPFSSLLLVALAACLLATGALAQSGRRKTDPSRQSPVPTPTPAPESQGESESKPLRGEAKNVSIVATFVVYEDESVELDFSVSGGQRDIVSRSFFERLRQAQSVEVTAGGKGTRGSARTRAKNERAAHVVHLQLEEDMLSTRDASRSRETLGRRDPSIYALRVSVYAPGGDLKYSDLTNQRTYRPTARIGGIPVPVPGGPERYPGEHMLAQLARDAADRLLARFNIQRPSDN